MNEYSAWIPSLAELLKECNARLGWAQNRLAEALGKDPSEISKILSGKTARPHDETLQAIVQVYQRAGLDVNFEQLQAARDAGRAGYPNPWQFPPEWLRLIIRVQANPDLSDWFYMRWAADFEQVTALLQKQSKREE